MADKEPIELLGDDGKAYPAHRLSMQIIGAICRWMDHQKLVNYEKFAKEEKHTVDERVSQRTMLLESDTTMLGALRSILFDPRIQTQMLRIAIRLAADDAMKAGDESPEIAQRKKIDEAGVLAAFGGNLYKTVTFYWAASGYKLPSERKKDGDAQEGDGGEADENPIDALMQTLTGKSTPDESAD